MEFNADRLSWMSDETVQEYVFDVLPIPVIDRRHGPQGVIYPFENMAVGTSFVARKSANTLWYSVKRYRKDGRMDREFKVRDLPEGGCRVWRVK